MIEPTFTAGFRFGVVPTSEQRRFRARAAQRASPRPIGSLLSSTASNVVVMANSQGPYCSAPDDGSRRRYGWPYLCRGRSSSLTSTPLSVDEGALATAPCAGSFDLRDPAQRKGRRGLRSSITCSRS